MTMQANGYEQCDHVYRASRKSQENQCGNRAKYTMRREDGTEERVCGRCMKRMTTGEDNHRYNKWTVVS